MDPLPTAFFARPTLRVARALLGCRLVHEQPERLRGPLEGRIVETEAYTEDDPACHASHLSCEPKVEGQSSRTRAHDLFAPPGRAYVYLIYGAHWLLNVVTEPEGTAGAVLIRAVDPEQGLEFMEEQRGVQRRVDLTNGPGKLTEAFAVDDAFHRTKLTTPPLYLADGPDVDEEEVAQSSRIGISKGVERQWRWFVADSRFVSNGTPSDS